MLFRSNPSWYLLGQGSASGMYCPCGRVWAAKYPDITYASSKLIFCPIDVYREERGLIRN